MKKARSDAGFFSGYAQSGTGDRCWNATAAKRRGGDPGAFPLPVARYALDWQRPALNTGKLQRLC
jgi:hypothetical protein